MDKIYVCQICGYSYIKEDGDESAGIAPGTDFNNLPDDWVCPVCGVDKSNFKEV